MLCKPESLATISSAVASSAEEVPWLASIEVKCAAASSCAVRAVTSSPRILPISSSYTSGAATIEATPSCMFRVFCSVRSSSSAVCTRARSSANMASRCISPAFCSCEALSIKLAATALAASAAACPSLAWAPIVN